MKPMFSAFAVMVAIMIGADLVLDRIGFSAQDRGSSSAVRLD